MKLRLLVAALAAVVAGAVSTGAVAAGASFHVIEARSLFPERAFVLSLPAEARLSASQVRVRENGLPVSDLSVTPAGGGSVRQFGVVLLIDASDSMRGHAIAGAMVASRAFASKRARQEQLAVIAFNQSPNVLLHFTDDGAAIKAALAGHPKLAYGTHIYDAVKAALRLLEQAHIRAGSIVVLSDGADTGSRTSEAAAAAGARAAHVRVFTVGLQSPGFEPRALRRLAADANGQYSLATSPAQLQRIYAALGSKFAREYVLSYRSAADPGERVAVAVRVKGLPGLAVSGYVTPSPESRAGGQGGSAYQESLWHKLWASSLTMIFVAFLVASLVALAVMVVVGSRRRGTLRRRMAQFVSIPEVQDEERPVALLTERVEEETERLLGRTRLWRRFLDELELSGITWSPRRLVLFTFISTFLSIWFLSLVSGSKLVALVGFVIPFGVRTVIRRKVARKRQQFAEQLPDNLQVLSSALRAGHSFIGALSVVVDDAPEPSRGEFRRVISDEQLGVSLEDALHVVVERMESRELEQVALVAAVQRSSGGNTAEVLDRVTETIRERFELRRTVRTLTAQGRLSRWVVTILPVFLLSAITLINPGYMHALYGSSGGRIALVFAALMVVCGSLVIKRIVNIKV
jgi:tight adherence protein B